MTTSAAEGILHETSLQCSQCPEISWSERMNLLKPDAIPPVDALLGRTSQRLLIETLLLTAIPADPLRPSFIVSVYSDGLLAQQAIDDQMPDGGNIGFSVRNKGNIELRRAIHEGVSRPGLVAVVQLAGEVTGLVGMKHTGSC